MTVLRAVRLSSSTYMPFEGQPIHLTDPQRDDLEEIARSNALPAGFVQRAKIVLLLAEGVSARAVDALDRAAAARTCTPDPVIGTTSGSTSGPVTPAPVPGPAGSLRLDAGRVGRPAEGRSEPRPRRMFRGRTV